MSDVEIGTLHKKSITRDINGNIINWLDETDGGWIIRGRKVINQKKFDEYVKKEHDKQVAAQAPAQQVTSPFADQRNGMPNAVKIETTEKSELEKRVDNMESKLDQILNALKK